MSCCKACNSKNIEELYSVEAKFYYPGSFYDLVRCRDCELIFLKTGYNLDDIGDLYPDDYHPHTPDRNKFLPLRNKLMTTLRRFIFTAKHPEESEQYRSLKKLLSFLYNKTAYRSIPYYRGGGQVLDIGCGTGAYLALMKRLGFVVQGVEPDKGAALYAQRSGFKVIHGTFEKASYPENYFDIITMWHVLEHFNNPVAVLKKIGKILKDDGQLLIGIPNYSSLDRMIFRENWNGFEIPLHLNHFTPSSISAVAQMAGFRCNNIIHTIRPSDMVSSICNFFGNENRIIDNIFIKKILFFLFIPVSVLNSVLRHSSILVIQMEKMSL